MHLQKTVESNIEETYSLAAMEYQGQTIEFPVLTQTTLSKLRTGVLTSESYLFIPDLTEETMIRNKQYVKEIKETGSCSVMRQTRSTSFGIPGYITYHSTLNYNATYYQGYLRIYDLISFNLEREIHTSAPFENFYNANATAIQIGTPGYPADPSVIQKQKKEYGEIQYGTLYAVPSEWIAVAPIADGPKIGVKYVIKHQYTNGTTNNLEYLHEAN